MISNSGLIGPLETAKFFFSAVYVAATIGVIVGVYWEREEFPKEKRDRGWRLLVSSLAVDTLFTILILGTDGWIGSIQRSEIIALETRLAPRLFSDAQVERIAKSLIDFKGQEFEITTYWDSDEPHGLANRIRAALDSAGWQYVPVRRSLLGGVEAVHIWSHPDADKKTKDAAEQLMNSLRRESVLAWPREQSPMNNPKHNRIIVNVGGKP